MHFVFEHIHPLSIRVTACTRSSRNSEPEVVSSYLIYPDET